MEIKIYGPVKDKSFTRKIYIPWKDYYISGKH